MENVNGNLFEMEVEKETVQSKKEMILSLYNSGTTEIEAIAAVSGAKPSYVGTVLHQAGLIDNYFDLYTSTNYPMNIYSKHFRQQSRPRRTASRFRNGSDDARPRPLDGQVRRSGNLSPLAGRQIKSAAGQ